MNNRHLTAKNPNNGGLYNKMPNPQAEFLPIKIKHLQNTESCRPAVFRHLEKKYSVHK
ncbi:hypothetical protein GTP44_22650 [Duganella sp. FT50W]|uniref:Uncharacterized protein n=1 Tax=Duganella lactea TaxID=2692173 RepID=A0A6L8MRP5_9BURK|nr:hypothetical protein [Duganella lactea]